MCVFGLRVWSPCSPNAVPKHLHVLSRSATPGTLPVQADALSTSLFILGFCLQKETGLLDCGLAVHNHCLVFVPLLQPFTLIEFLIKAQAIHTAGVL